MRGDTLEPVSRWETYVHLIEKLSIPSFTKLDNYVVHKETFDDNFPLLKNFNYLHYSSQRGHNKPADNGAPFLLTWYNSWKTYVKSSHANSAMTDWVAGDATFALSAVSLSSIYLSIATESLLEEFSPSPFTLNINWIEQNVVLPTNDSSWQKEKGGTFIPKEKYGAVLYNNETIALVARLRRKEQLCQTLPRCFIA